MISYRGPSVAGGVSQALAQLFTLGYFGNGKWWFIEDNSIKTLTQIGEKPYLIKPLDINTIGGHYRFCNEFLWPIVHDLPQYISFSENDYNDYIDFNSQFETELNNYYARLSTVHWFIHDYQLALLPKFLGAKHKIIFFWHIPWPFKIDSQYIDIVKELVKSLLNSSVIGFHTQEYKENFLRFAYNNFSEFTVDFDNDCVFNTNTKNKTKVLLAPLGIDFKAWEKLANIDSDKIKELTVSQYMPKIPYILSVDRADYTKGLYQRIQAIQYFFENHPQYLGKINFVQLSGRTRPGLKQFDDYFTQCKNLANLVNSCWSKDDWQPIIWLEQHFDIQDLAIWYRMANIMLVNPVRDGLNLTAKEYIACQGIPLMQGNPGMLNLSSGAGAFWQIGKYSIFSNFLSPSEIAKSIYECLQLTKKERAYRMDLLVEAVAKDGLKDWWLQLKENFEKIVM